MVARYCGLANYASVYGFTVLAIASASALGSSAIGFAYDLSGSYTPALVVCAASFALAGLCYLGLGRFPVPAQA